MSKWIAVTSVERLKTEPRLATILGPGTVKDIDISLTPRELESALAELEAHGMVRVIDGQVRIRADLYRQSRRNQKLARYN